MTLVRQELAELAPERLHPADDNPREGWGDLAGLKASIKEHGILQPIVVEALGPDLYQIVAGERRWAAAKELGLATVPCLVRTGLERRRAAMVVENLQRRNLRPLEEAQAFDRMLEAEPELSQYELARRIGKSQSYVSRRLLLLELPKGVQRKVASGEVSTSRALGYEPAAPAADVFSADEELNLSWRELRQDAIDSGDRRTLQLLSRFAKAFGAYKRFLESGSRGQIAANG